MAVLIAAVAIAWLLVVLAVAVVIGMGIAEADRPSAKSCCPHPPSEAPETVRGEFRAIVTPRRPAAGDGLGTQLDVRA